MLIICWLMWLSGAVGWGRGGVANCLGSLLSATWLLLEAAVNAQATWFLAQREAKTCLPAVVVVGRATSSELGFLTNIDRGCDGEMKHKRVLVTVWSGAVCLCETDGSLL